MRKCVLTLLVCLLAVPAIGSAALMRTAGDGTLSVEDGRGTVVLSVRGGVIGRFDRGSVTIVDLTPHDAFEPKVWGAERDSADGERHTGRDVRFRVIGGEFFVLVNGAGIELSAVGSGWTTLTGRGRDPGLFSLDGEECSAPRASCRELPSEPRKFRLGTDAVERSDSALR